MSFSIDNMSRLGNNFYNLLWDDILFVKILPLLTLKELFVLRGLSNDFKRLIDTYFMQMKQVNFGTCNKTFTPEAFKVLSHNCRQLQTLCMPNCDWLTDDLIIPLFQHNSQLTKIVLNQCSGLTSICLQPIIINCKDLKSLSLANCAWLTIGCLESITLHQRNLVEVDFSACHLIDRLETINNFLIMSENIKALNLSKLSCVNDQMLSNIAHSAKHLEMLNISQCTSVSGYGISLVVEYCRHLKGVICVGCPFAPINLLPSKRTRLGKCPMIIGVPSPQVVQVRLPRLNV